jgi:hypothetical protein
MLEQVCSERTSLGGQLGCFEFSAERRRQPVLLFDPLEDRARREGLAEIAKLLQAAVPAVSGGVGSPRLVLMREPDQLGVEGAHLQLAFGVRLIELAKPNSHIAAHDDRAPSGLDDYDLHASCVAGRWDHPKPAEQFQFAIDRHVLHTGRIDPFANRVVLKVVRVFELATLDVDRLAGEEVVASAMVEVQMRSKIALTRDSSFIPITATAV